MSQFGRDMAVLVYCGWVSCIAWYYALRGWT